MDESTTDTGVGPGVNRKSRPERIADVNQQLADMEGKLVQIDAELAEHRAEMSLIRPRLRVVLQNALEELGAPDE
jgi:uncharacterized coiled-coil protein SlyX